MSLANTDFDGYVKSLNPVLYRSFLGGDLNARDVYNRATTPSPTADWHRRKAGWGVQHHATATVVADGAEQRGPAGTLFVEIGGISEIEVSHAQSLISKRTPLGLMWLFYFLRPTDDTLYLVFYGGAASSMYSFVYHGPGSGFAVTFQSGTFPAFYVDGVFRSLGNIPSGVIAPSPQAINIGSRFDNSSIVDTPVHVALQFASILTDEQISDLHRLYLEDARGVPTAPARTISLPKHDLNGALLYLAGPKNALGNVVDLSGNGLDAAVTGRVGEEREHVSGTRAQHFHGAGAGVVTVPASALLTGHVGQTYSGLVRIDGDGEGTTGRIFSVNEGIAERIRLHPQGGTTLTFGRRFSDGIATWRLSNRPGDGLPYHYLLRHDGDPTHVPTININGRAAALTVVAARAGVVNTNAPQAYFGNVGGLGRNFNGILGASKFHGSVLSDTEARNEYLQHGTRAIELAPRRAYPVTLVDVAAGRVGPWDRISGTWSYRDDGERRQLVNVVAGACAAPSDQAYGAWYGRLSKSVGALDAFFFQFIASAKEIFNHATQNGYMIAIQADGSLRLYVITAGAFALFAFTAAGYIVGDTKYEFLLTRNYVGYFTLWVRGGVYTTWTTATTGTNNTHTTSRFVCPNFDPTDELSDVVFYPLGDTLDPRTEVPGLED